MFVKEMTQEECIAVVSNGRMGNLACARDNRPYVVPIYYAYAENHLYSLSMPGQKIDWMRTNPRVCVQVGSFSERTAWQSVVMHGLYKELPDTPDTEHDREHAWSLLQHQVNWWEPGGRQADAATDDRLPGAHLLPHRHRDHDGTAEFGALEQWTFRLNRSAGDGLGQGRGVWRGSHWWCGRAEARRIWPKPPGPPGFRARAPTLSGRSADGPHRPSPPSAWIVSPYEKQN